MVHRGTPASTILESEAGVFSCDMQDMSEFRKLTRLILNLNQVVDHINRERKLEELGITWESYAQRIAELYEENFRY